MKFQWFSSTYDYYASRIAMVFSSKKFLSFVNLWKLFYLGPNKTDADNGVVLEPTTPSFKPTTGKGPASGKVEKL